MIAFAEWIAWAATLALSLYYWLGIAADFAHERTPRHTHAFYALTYTLLCSWFFVIPEWSKLHLLWLTPMVFLALFGGRIIAFLYRARFAASDPETLNPAA